MTTEITNNRYTLRTFTLAQSQKKKQKQITWLSSTGGRLKWKPNRKELLESFLSAQLTSRALKWGDLNPSIQAS